MYAQNGDIRKYYRLYFYAWFVIMREKEQKSFQHKRNLSKF